jgi:6-pyruvoyltetrahydropterin/6-carboxytetrahydropterin synthase
MAKFYSTKTYGNDRGLSCCFRQWKSTHSHCCLLHGYSIGIKLIFESDTLDDRNWVMDFGGLKAFKEWAEYMFDHTLVVTEDDPHLNFFKQMSHMGDPPASGTGSITNIKPHERGALCDLRIVEGVGCEKFAELAYKQMAKILFCFKTNTPYKLFKENNVIDSFEARYPIGLGVHLRSVEVFEHEGNSAIYEG